MLRLYRLDAGTDSGSLSPYATIAEAHHPEHIAADQSLPELSELTGLEDEALAAAALSTLMANLE